MLAVINEALFKDSYIVTKKPLALILLALILLSFLWKSSLLISKEPSRCERIKITAKRIFIIGVLSAFIAKYGYKVMEKNNWEVVYIVSLLAYIVYCFLNSLEKYDDYSSVLAVIDGVMVTGLSMLHFTSVLIGAAGVSILALIIRRCFDLKHSDAWMIVILCAEAVLFSKITFIRFDTCFDVFVKTFFIETVIFALNCYLGGIFVDIFNEDKDEYWYRLKGL